MKLRRGRKDRKTSSLDTTTDQQLPMDLMMDIFSRLSLKTIAICRCVSKQWSSVLGHSDFRDLLLTRSHARPRSLLFACIRDNKAFFLSSPQPQAPSSSSDHHISFSFNHTVRDISTSVSGFVCVSTRGYRFENGRKFMVEESVICNPSTGQSLTIPKMKTRKRTGMVRFLGYDPVEKQHKVLGIIRDRTMEHQVLTLGGGTEKATWRMTERGIPCDSYASGDRRNICINGVFYYIEMVRDKDGCGRDHRIICFDVRSEKYNFVKFPEMIWVPKLLDCNGKLGLVSSGSIFAETEEIEIWVLQDTETHEWSRRVYLFPPMWKDVVDQWKMLEIVGVTGPNEFVMSHEYSSEPFHVYYCNFDKETVTRVIIRGMGAFGSGRRYDVQTYLNHVEDVKLMKL